MISKSNTFQFTELPLPDSNEANEAGHWPRMRLVFLAGETSGDHIGGAVLKALAEAQIERHVRLEVAGTGGMAMEHQGMPSLLPLHRFNHMGFTNVLINLPKLLGAINTVKRAVQAANPDAVVAIDSQGYSGQVLRSVRSETTRRIQLVAPTVWAAHPQRAEKLAVRVDRLLCIYPFEPPLFEVHGLRSDFVGHPLVKTPLPEQPGAFKDRYKIPPRTQLIALLPGSREIEVDHLFPIFAKAIRQLEAQGRDSIQVAIPTAPLVRARVTALAKRYLPDAIVVEQEQLKWQLFHDADLALCCAGTAVIELSLCKTPIVLGYTHDWLTNILAGNVWNGFASIANINAGREIHPEFVLHDCLPRSIAQAAVQILNDKAYSGAMAEAQYDSILQMGVTDQFGGLVPPATVAAHRILDEVLGENGTRHQLNSQK